MNISSLKINSLFSNTIFRLLTLNMFLVIIGYAVGKIQGIITVDQMRITKGIVLFISFIFVIYKNGLSTKFIKNTFSIYLVIFMVSLLSFFSDDPIKSIYKSITFTYPFLYVLYSLNYLLQYGSLKLLISFSLAILLVYTIVPIAFYLGNRNMESNLIYGYTEGDYFVSNHYGWGSALFLLSAFTIMRFYPISTKFKMLIYLFSPFVVYLLFASANRASIIAVFIAFIFYLFKDNRASLFIKIGVLFIAAISFIFLSYQLGDVYEFLQNKNQIQLETGSEGRLIGTQAMLNSFHNMPIYWITGVGMFNYTELKYFGGILSSYHNSYWEILFGSGILTFLFFFNFMLLRPFITFWKKTATYSLLFIPLAFIPFFESNLTAGQFLFFPWFSYMIILNAKELNR